MKKNKYRKHVSKRITKAIFEYDMIEPGDKVLVGISGGKDSITLLKDLSARAGQFKIPFTVEAVHVEGDFFNCYNEDHLGTIVRDMGVKYHKITVGIEKRLKPGKKMNCYWCSMQRRIELLKFAVENGFQKIALGHHMDDIIETLFMNMFNGSISTMPPKIVYDNKPISLIRPLAYVEEKDIISFMTEQNLSSIKDVCPYDENSERKKIRAKIHEFTNGSSTTKRKIFESMRHIDLDYLT